jgi:hypothetical protein
MNLLAKNLGALVLLSSLAVGCAETAATTAGAGAAATAATGTGAGASMGLSDSLIQVAVQAAKSYLSTKMGAAQGAVVTAEDKATAATQGVEAAATKAKADGKELTEEQKTGLGGLLKGML